MRKRFTYTQSIFFVLILIFIGSSLVGQVSDKRFKSYGIGYYGELGLHPGLHADVTFEIADNSTRRFHSRKLLFRPSIAYFFRPYYTHNYLVLPNALFQIGTKQKEKYLFYFELSGKTGYLRYQYIGDQYISTPTGIQSIKRQGGNALIYGLGFLIGVKTQAKRSYYLAIDYLKERSEDLIRPTFIAFKIGVRFDTSPSQKSINE